MAEQKRFYWIKLKENFFDLETIDWLISQKNGCEYIVLYQKLCLIAANKDGRLAMQIGEMIIPYDAQKIARDTKFDIDTVIVAMELFKRIGLIFEESDGVLKIPYVNEIVGSETSSAQRMRKSRAKKALESGKKETKKLSQCDADVTQEKEYRDKRLDFRDLREKDVEAEEESSDSDYNDPDNQLKSFCEGVFLSDKQTEDLLNKMGLETFDYYIARLKNYPNISKHYETMLKWYNEDRKVKCS